MNILLTYLYRDAGNYKQWGEVVFTDLAAVDPAALESEIRRYLIDGHWFVAEDVGLPDLRPQERDEAIDHDWHEFHSFSESGARPDDAGGRDVRDWIRDLRRAHRAYPSVVAG